jgi:acetate kinase
VKNKKEKQMKVLVVNCGSSSIKYSLFDMDNEQELARGLVDRIGEEVSAFTQKSEKNNIKLTQKVNDHKEAFALFTKHLLDSKTDVLANIDEIEAVGHRVVHGGERFYESALIDEKAIKIIERYSSLAPLHNPPNLVDHWYEKYGIRRYGFHGTSHRYVAIRASELLNKPLDKVNLITCHLGNGCSMAAIKNGQSVDTSMGLTPLEGLVMGTRCGDIDPAILFFLAEKENVSLKDMDKLLNKKSGLLGVSELSNDVRTLLENADKGNKKARLALDMFAYRIKKYIGAYTAVLNGVDAIVLTGGVGDKAKAVRKNICQDLEYLGIELDESKNDNCFEQEAVISKDSSKIKILVIPTNEELMIARDSIKIAS